MSAINPITVEDDKPGTSTTTAPTTPTTAPTTPLEYSYEGGIVNNLIGVGKFCTTLGFNVVQVSTFTGFRIAQYVVNITANNLTDTSVGHILSPTNVVNVIRSTVFAAELVTFAGLCIGHATSILSLRLTDYVMDKTGIAEAGEVCWRIITTTTITLLLQ